MPDSMFGSMTVIFTCEDKYGLHTFIALTVGRQDGQPACSRTQCCVLATVTGGTCNDFHMFQCSV